MRFTRQVLLVFIGFACCTTPAEPYATDLKAFCEVALEAQARALKTPELRFETLTTVADTPLASYFHLARETEDPRESGNSLLVFLPENLERFVGDLYRLLSAKAQVSRFPMQQFHRWLWENQGFHLLDAVAIQDSVRANSTLRIFADGLVKAFEIAAAKQAIKLVASQIPWKWRMLQRVRSGRRLLRRPATALGTALFFTAILELQAPISGFINVPLSPINDFTSRVGVRYLSGSASFINDMVNRFDNMGILSSTNSAGEVDKLKLSLIQTADTLGKYDFRGLTREQVKSIWDHFESKWFDYTQHASKLLNMNTSAGRGSYLVGKIQDAEGYAIKIMQVRTNVEVIKLRAESLNQEIAHSAQGTPTDSQQKLLTQYDQDLERARRLMAVIVADWLLNRLFYPDLWNAPQMKNSTEAVYASMDDYLELPIIAALLKDDLVRVFEIIDHKLSGVPESLDARQNRR